MPARTLIATDAWTPLINGVVVTLVNIIALLRKWGHEVEVVSPEGLRTMPMPTYPEIRLAVFPDREVARRIREFQPDTIHIATEGPIGLAARRYCIRHGLRFTSAYHTCFPEYVQPRLGVPLAWSYAWLRRFHSASSAVLVGTDAVASLLQDRGFEQVARYTLGVDLELFRPVEDRFTDMQRPVFTYVGRVALEKDIPAFLRLDLPGSKLVVGDGPERERLQRRFPDVRFVGFKTGQELASYFQRSDAFVFPSRTDTFGLVMLEALACGVPVAALPVRGPIDVLKDRAAGVLDADLRRAALDALSLDRTRCRKYAESFPWENTGREFVSHLVSVLAPAQRGTHSPATTPSAREESA